MRQPLTPQQLRGRHQFRSAQAKLCILAAAVGPFAGGPAKQLEPHADQRLHARSPRESQDGRQLLQFFDHQHHLLAQLRAHQRASNKGLVLKPIANDQATRLIQQRQCGVQLRAATHFQAKIKRPAGIDDFFHHFTQLIDLHREHPAISAAVSVPVDGLAKRAVDGLHTMAHDILKPQQHRIAQAALARFGHHRQNIHRRARLLPRPHLHAPAGIDTKIPRTPAADIVQAAGIINGPCAVGRGSAHRAASWKSPVVIAMRA